MNSSILIIDDHEVLADLLTVAIEQRGIGSVTSISPDADRLDATALAESIRPDLCLLDLDLGKAGNEGMSLISEFVANQITVVVFTGAEDPVTFGTALELGARGVIHKRTPFDQVVEHLASALAGGEVNTQGDKYEWLMAATRARKESAARSEAFERLTKREAEVLGGLVHGLHVEDIADQSGVSVVTVRSQVRAVLQKLNVSSQLTAVALAHRNHWTPPPGSPRPKGAS